MPYPQEHILVLVTEHQFGYYFSPIHPSNRIAVSSPLYHSHFFQQFYRGAMEDFLSDVTEDMIETRLAKMREFLRQEHSEILRKMEGQAEEIQGFKKSKNSSTSHEEVQRCYGLFQRACSQILDTYFPLLCEEDFLILQSEQEVMEKMSALKATINRNASNLIRRLSKPKEEVEKEKKIKKDGKKKGKNSKMAVESTSIMQRWLLENFHDPYPTPARKQEMARESGLTVYQVNNWFINARQRVIKRFLKKEAKEQPGRAMKSEDEDSS